MKPYAFGSLVREVYHNVRKVDVTTTLATSVALLSRPGGFIRGYLAGKRVGYINPIKFFFYSLVADLILRHVLSWIASDPHLSAGVTADPIFQMLGLVSAILWGVLWRVFYRRSDLTLPEFGVVALYFESQTNFLTIVVLILTFPLRSVIWRYETVLITTELVIAGFYGLFFAYQLFRESWLSTFVKQTFLMGLYLGLLLLLLDRITHLMPLSAAP